MLAWRLGISSLLIPSLIVILWLDARSGTASVPLFFLAELLAVRSVFELVEMFRSRIPRLRWPVPALCTAVAVLSGWLPHWVAESAPELASLLFPLGIGMSLILLLAFEIFRFRQPGDVVERLGASAFIICYCGVLLALTAQLRWQGDGAWGMAALGSLIVGVKSGDIGAYTFGRLFGRKKLAPHLSPGKTREGGLGAVVTGAVCCWLWLEFAVPAMLPGAVPGPAWASLLYGAILAVTGGLGDLAESLLKRDVGVKDSGALMPGFGGLLDLLDSVLYGGPVALLLWQVLPLLKSS